MGRRGDRHSVAHRRYTQGSQLPVRLGDVDASYRLRSVGLGAQGLLPIPQKPLHPLWRRFDRGDRHAVPTGRAPIGAHPFPGRLQRVPPINPVIQHLEPELRPAPAGLAFWPSFCLRVESFSGSGLSRPVSGAISAPVGCPVVGVFSKRLSFPLTEACFCSGPFAPRSLPASSLLWAGPTPDRGRSQGYLFPQGVGLPI